MRGSAGRISRQAPSARPGRTAADGRRRRPRRRRRSTGDGPHRLHDELAARGTGVAAARTGTDPRRRANRSTRSGWKWWRSSPTAAGRPARSSTRCAAAISGTAACSATPRCAWRNRNSCESVSRERTSADSAHSRLNTRQSRTRPSWTPSSASTSARPTARSPSSATASRIVFDEDGDPILPSFVGLSEDGRLLVGKAARNQWVLAPERTIKSIKRKMGQDVKVKLGDQEYRPQEISAMILRALRDRAASAAGPAGQQGGHHRAGLLQRRPAAGHARGRRAGRPGGRAHPQRADRRLADLRPQPAASCARMLVYDLGGGTFDVSIVQAAGGRRRGAVQPRRHAARRRRLRRPAAQARLRPVPGRSTASTCAPTSSARPASLRAVEAAKRQLSYHPFARIEEEFIAEKDGAGRCT